MEDRNQQIDLLFSKATNLPFQNRNLEEIVNSQLWPAEMTQFERNMVNRIYPLFFDTFQTEEYSKDRFEDSLFDISDFLSEKRPGYVYDMFAFPIKNTNKYDIINKDLDYDPFDTVKDEDGDIQVFTFISQINPEIPI